MKIFFEVFQWKYLFLHRSTTCFSDIFLLFPFSVILNFEIWKVLDWILFHHYPWTGKTGILNSHFCLFLIFEGENIHHCKNLKHRKVSRNMCKGRRYNFITKSNTIWFFLKIFLKYYTIPIFEPSVYKIVLRKGTLFFVLNLFYSSIKLFFFNYSWPKNTKKYGNVLFA